MKRSTERILTTHVGSLIRPAPLREVIGARENGLAYREEALASILRDAVKDVVLKQSQLGLDVVSDGEYGKTGWNRYVAERMDGFVHREWHVGEKRASNFDLSGEAARFGEFYAAYGKIQSFDWEAAGRSKESGASLLASAADTKRLVWECVGPIQYKGHAALRRDVENFKSGLASATTDEAFVAAASPASARGNWLNSFYATESDLMTALADAMKEEYRSIVDSGFVLQVDDPYLADQYGSLVARLGPEVALRRLEEGVELLNHALLGIPEERVRYHLCWGSWNGPHTTDVPLKTIVDIVLKVRAQAYSVEAANQRHEHEWQVWKAVKLPESKILIPGLVAHSTNVVEHPELVAWRIGNFASVVGPDRIIAGTDCGFSQSYNHMRMHPSIQWAKLEALVEGARIASKQLGLPNA